MEIKRFSLENGNLKPDQAGELCTYYEVGDIVHLLKYAGNLLSLSQRKKYEKKAKEMLNSEVFDLYKNIGKVQKQKIPMSELDLRDHFASSIFTAVYQQAMKEATEDMSGLFDDPDWPSQIARDAYNMADAMIEARAKNDD